MFDDKNKENDWGFDEVSQVLEGLFGDDPDFISQSDLKRIADDMKILFYGKYNCESQCGRVDLPMDCIKVWAIAEIADDEIFRKKREKCIFLANELSRFDSEELSVLTSGECLFDENGMWVLPKETLAILDSENLICEGLGMYAELMTQRVSEQKEARVFEYLNSLNKE